MIKVALIEFNDFHYNEMEQLFKTLTENGVECHCFMNDRAKERIEGISDEFMNHFRFEESILGSMFFNSNSLSSICRFIQKEKFSHILINSLRPDHLKDFIKHLKKPDQFQISGIIHDLRLIKELDQQELNTIFVMSDYLNLPKDDRLKELLPRFEPIPYEPSVKGSLNIGIFGEINRNRKDLQFLLEFLVMNRPAFDLKFKMLGDATTDEAQDFVYRVFSTDCQEFFEFNDGFMPESKLTSELSQCDMIMPLIHDRSEGLVDFTKHKTCSSFIAIREYAIPGLLDQYWEHANFFRSQAVYYNEENLATRLKALSEDKSTLIELREKLISEGKKNIDMHKRTLYSSLGISLDQ